MRRHQRPTCASQDLPRRFVGWVWHTDHDDRIPNVVEAAVVAIAIVVMIVGATSVWLILGLVAVFVSAVLLIAGMEPPPRPPAERGRLNDSVSLYRSILRSSEGRS